MKRTSEREKGKKRRIVFPFLSIIRSLCHRIMKLFVFLSQWRHSSYSIKWDTWNVRENWMSRRKAHYTNKKVHTTHKASCTHTHNDANHPFDICLAFSERMLCARVRVRVREYENGSKNKNGFFCLEINDQSVFYMLRFLSPGSHFRHLKLCVHETLA